MSPPSPPAPRWLKWLGRGFGVLFIAALGLWRKEERPYTVILFLLVLLPPAFALAYPVLGWSSADLLFGALSPLCVIAASFGMFRIPLLLEHLYRKWKEEGKPPKSKDNAKLKKPRDELQM